MMTQDNVTDNNKHLSKMTIAEEFREMERLRSIARRDEETALRLARDEEREKWQDVIASKDAEIANKDSIIANKDALIAGKDAEIASKESEIARLREQLAPANNF